MENASTTQKFEVISDMRVFELKNELEKRGLDRSGSKHTLVGRLQEAVREEGHDPDTYRLPIVVLGKKIAKSDEGKSEETVTDVGEKVIANSNSNDTELQSMDTSKVSASAPLEESDNTLNGGNNNSSAVQGDSSSHAIEITESLPLEEGIAETYETCTDEPSVTAGASCTDSQDDHAKSERVTHSSLWVKGITPATKAADLKTIFARVGHVLSAKIFIRRQQPSSNCYGFVTMIDKVAADLCIQMLNGTVINGGVVTVEHADRSISAAKSTKKSASSLANSVSEHTSKIGAVSIKKHVANSQNPDDAKGMKKEKVITRERKVANMPPVSAKIEAIIPEKSGRDSKQFVQKSTKEKRAETRSTPKTISKVRRLPPVYVSGRRVLDKVESKFSRIPSEALSRKANLLSARRSAKAGKRAFNIRRALHGPSYALTRREQLSRRIESIPSREKQEMMELMRKKEEEHRLKEQELRLEREKERLKFERERIERERLELQQLRIASLVPHASSIITSRRSRENFNESSVASRRLRNVRVGADGGDPPSHRISGRTTSRRMDDRRNAASVHSSRPNVSRRDRDRRRERDRDRSRHSTSTRSREYSSRNSARDPPYVRSTDPSVVRSTYERDLMCRRNSAYESGSRRDDSAFDNREINYGAYSRDNIPSTYSKEISGYSGSRSMGPSSWMNSENSPNFVGNSSRGYGNQSDWVASLPSQSHSVNTDGWQSSPGADRWSGGNSYSQEVSHSHYARHGSYDTFNRRY